MIKTNWDVLVIGAGPAGAAASKRSVESGFSTLLLERRSLPRDKVCSGMIMGPWAWEALDAHFGVLPEGILTKPPILKGHKFHVPGCRPQVLEWPTPLAWRKDFDFWLVQKARTAGVEVRDKIEIKEIDGTGNPLRVLFASPDGEKTITAQWIIGADGAGSLVRKKLFSGISWEFSIPLRECYTGSLALEKDYFHWFFPRGRPRPRFNINHKGNCFLIEGSGIPELREDINRTLIEYGFDPSCRPEWRDGCMVPKLHNDLVSGAFSPAKGNIMLVGDAAGLLLPITFEGIGTALKSGVLAADSIRQAAQKGKASAPIYLSTLQPIIEQIRLLLAWQKNVDQTAPMDPTTMARLIKEAYERTLIIN